MRVETPDDARAATLAHLLDEAGVPLHVRYGNAALTDLLAEDHVADYATSPDVVVLALRRRKVRCPACQGSGGEHLEDPDADVDRFTPGAG